MFTLPLSGLKRGEVYSFLGGLFASIPWTFYLLEKQSIQSLNTQSDISKGLIFVWMWLLITAIAYSLSYLIYWIYFTNADYYWSFNTPEWHLDKIGFTGQKLLFYEREAQQELLTGSHICFLISISILILIYPLSSILKLSDIVATVLIVVSAFFLVIGYFRHYRLYWILTRLWQSGHVVFTDDKVMCEYGSGLYAILNLGYIPNNLNKGEADQFRKSIETYLGKPIIIFPF